MPDDFSDLTELFLRAVRPPNTFPNFWNKGRLSSAAFKDPNGLSVERTLGRQPEDVAQSMKKKLDGLIYGVSVEECKENSICMRHLPSKTNPFHCELHGSEEQRILTSSQARALAQCAKCILS